MVVVVGEINQDVLGIGNGALASATVRHAPFTLPTIAGSRFYCSRTFSGSHRCERGATDRFDVQSGLVN